MPEKVVNDKEKKKIQAFLVVARKLNRKCCPYTRQKMLPVNWTGNGLVVARKLDRK